MPDRRASILPPIALCGLLLTAACARGSAPQEEAAVADSSDAVRTDVSAAVRPAEAGDSAEVTAVSGVRIGERHEENAAADVSGTPGSPAALEVR